VNGPEITLRHFDLDVPDTLTTTHARAAATSLLVGLLTEAGLMLAEVPEWATDDSDQYGHVAMSAVVATVAVTEYHKAAAVAGDAKAYARLGRNDRRAVIAELAADGYSDPRIAALLDVDERSVRSIRQRNGIASAWDVQGAAS
jgi:hypothetical protein